MTIDRVLSLIVGLAIIFYAINLAVHTFMLPGAEPSRLAKLVFRSVQTLFGTIARRMRSTGRRENLLGLFAPLALLTVLFVSIAMIGAGFAFVFHAAGGGGFNESIYYSASSISTLGFAEPPLGSITLTMLTVVETMSSAAVISLLIGYLPNIYSDYTEREQTVTRLMTEVDNSTSGQEIVATFAKSPGLDQMDDIWKDWTDWFSHLGTTHASITSALFIRSPAETVSWVAVAAALLDACSLILAAVPVEPATRQRVERCLTMGVRAVNNIAVRLGAELPGPDATWPATPITVSQAEFNAALDTIAAAGAEVDADREQAWRAFAQRRVLYDHAIIGLCRSKMLTQGTWSGDRPAARTFLPLPIRRVGKL